MVGEIALAVILLAGAGLLIRSLAALHDVALGFRPEKVLVMETSVPASEDIESVTPCRTDSTRRYRRRSRRFQAFRRLERHDPPRLMLCPGATILLIACPDPEK